MWCVDCFATHFPKVKWKILFYNIKIVVVNGRKKGSVECDFFFLLFFFFLFVVAWTKTQLNNRPVIFRVSSRIGFDRWMRGLLCCGVAKKKRKRNTSIWIKKYSNEEKMCFPSLFNWLRYTLTLSLSGIFWHLAAAAASYSSRYFFPISKAHQKTCTCVCFSFSSCLGGPPRRVRFVIGPPKKHRDKLAPAVAN